MKADLVARISADDTLASLLGTGPDNAKSVRWGGFLRGDNYPAIALSIVSPGEEWTHDGPDGLDGPRVRFDLRAAKAGGAEALAVAVRALMHAGGDQGDTRFHPASLEAERSIDAGEQPGGAEFCQVQLEFIFYHEEI